jgi:hypothetical protein
MQRKRFVQLRNRQTLRELRSELTDAYRCTQLTFDEWVAFLKGMRLCRLQKCVLFSSRQRAHRRQCWQRTDPTARDSDASGPRYRVLCSPTMSTILKYSRFARVPISRHARALATPATSGSPVAKKSPFTETLADGPSLDDFVSGNVPERIVLGNKNRYAETFFPPNRTRPDSTHTLIQSSPAFLLEDVNTDRCVFQ